MSEKLAERFLGAPQPFTGICRGGPYDGQHLAHDRQRYHVVIMCSTSDDVMTMRQWEAMTKYANTEYVWTDSTWVWRK